MSAHVADGPAPPLFGWRRGPFALVAGAIGLAFLLALSGAFDTDEIGAARRAVLWLVVSGLLIGQAALADRALARLAPSGRAGRVLAACVAVALTIALMTVELQGLKLTPLAPSVWGHDAFLDLALFISPTVAVVAGLTVLLCGPPVRRAAQGRAPTSEAALPGTSEWPGDPVLWVRAHDHYLEVATASRTVFLRGRMSDAVGRLEDAPGIQVHRSWWVAKAAFASVRREGRDLVLVLEGGVRAPVGRSRVAALRARGWF